MLEIHVVFQFMAPRYALLGEYPELGGIIFLRGVGTHQQHYKFIKNQ